MPSHICQLKLSSLPYVLTLRWRLHFECLIFPVLFSECKRSTEFDPDISCVSDTMTVSWPTDVILPGSVNAVPEKIRRNILPNLKRGNILPLPILSLLPP